MMTVIMFAKKELDNVKMSVESFRLFCDMDISFVLMDDGSVEGLQEWAKEQADLTYVFLDEGQVGYGKGMNLVRKELQIKEDLLLMEEGFLLTPGCLGRMTDALYEEGEIGAVGGVVNDDLYCQNIPSHISSYQDLIEAASEGMTADRKEAMMLYSGAVLWKGSAMDAVGAFDENLRGMFSAVNDFCLRMVMADQKLKVCSDACFWNIGEGKRTACKEDLEALERKWGMHYFNGCYNNALISLIEEEREAEISVLEIGCDCGASLLEIRNRFPNARLYGSEINAKAAQVASHFAQVAVNNIEEKNLPFSGKKFDYIIFGDVLEHLHDPLEALAYCREFLDREGCVLASIPNLMHISVMEEILRGDFTYRESGLLDKTHIHFFTYNEMLRMFLKAGYETEKIVVNTYPMSERQKQLTDGLLALDARAERFMYETFQYIVRAKRN